MAASGAIPGFDSMPGCILELIATKLSFQQRVALTGVNRHWRQALTSSPTLWRTTVLDFTEADEERVGQMLAFAAARAQGIRELELTVGESEQWADAAFLLGTLRPALRRCQLVAVDSSVELPWKSAAFVYGLRGLTSLDLDTCVGTLGPGLGQLTALRELCVSRDEPSYEFEVPRELGRLTALTRLELVRCLSEPLPAEVGQLTRLRLLNLHGSDLLESTPACNAVLGSLMGLEELDLGCCRLSDVPPALGLLTRLTTLVLENAFASQSWSQATWEDKLGCLGRLTRLVYLELAENELPVIPQSVAGLTALETLKMALNPVSEAGIPDGPYLASLMHLDLRGSQVATLPPHMTRAQNLQFLGLSCCHELELDRALAEGVIGRLASLGTLSLCAQMLHTVDSARMMHALGRMLPALEITSHEEVEEDDSDEDEDDIDADESEYDSEDEYDTEDVEAFDQHGEGWGSEGEGEEDSEGGDPWDLDGSEFDEDEEEGGEEAPRTSAVHDAHGAQSGHSAHGGGEGGPAPPAAESLAAPRLVRQCLGLHDLEEEERLFAGPPLPDLVAARSSGGASGSGGGSSSGAGMGGSGGVGDAAAGNAGSSGGGGAGTGGSGDGSNEFFRQLVRRSLEGLPLHTPQ